jgi:hypothetical protein
MTGAAMRLAAALLVALACSGAFASEPGQPATTDSTTPKAPVSSQAAPQVRQASDADLIIKEWHSPITFEVDASWLRTLPFRRTAKLVDLPSFYCDGVTLESAEVTKKLNGQTGAVKLEFKIPIRARRAESDKVVRLEFALRDGERLLLLGTSKDLEVPDGYTYPWRAAYMLPKDTFAAYSADGSNSRLQISMIVQDN